MATIKTAKKGDSVILCGFTGMRLGVFNIISCNDKTIEIEKKNGTKVKFSRKTGKQMDMEEGKERFAGFIIEDDGSYVAPNRAKKLKEEETKPAKKAAKKKAKPAPDFDEEDEEEQEEVKPSKKVRKIAKTKKAMDEDGDEYEDAE